ncbi:MAG: SRPBCC domain-containing protein [Pseudomonadota bacterium]
MPFTSLSTGQVYGFGGRYVELGAERAHPHHRQFRRSQIAGGMVTTVSLKPVSCGTDFSVVQEGIPEAIPAEACCPGWQESPALLALPVEAEIKE